MQDRELRPCLQDPLRSLGQIITWATMNSVPIQVRGSGHMWINSLPSSGVVINTLPLASIAIDAASGTATIGAGTLVGEATDAAHAADVHLPLAACPSVTVIGPLLVGVLGRSKAFMSHQDLFYALRGAGNSFVAVTEITMRAYPKINRGIHFSRDLSFVPSEAVGEAVNALPRIPHAKMQLYMVSPAQPLLRLSS
ncbi:hypothetical protein VC83_01919 [Pseudogymnoascus destructans]|uniref:FAD linked oxidase N-terminal domain-containing protein n=1 Tax=Pseudogymnoascus destructans TaxID=655981 RepID=A0A177AJX8_9PEZI|nr:uncharacterized protein VC83_01919 [Pseudogymnoascus destructans]OAF61474.1 hypothetical protein VC83_01919 [Pseudogymnoascus destructans]